MFYETDLVIVLAWSEWVELGTNSPHRISGSGLHRVCSPSVLQPSCLLGKYHELGIFCEPLPTSDTVSESLHCQWQILRFFFSCQAFNHWPQLGLLSGCLNSLLARGKHLSVRSQSALHVVVLMYFPHNCDSTACRVFVLVLSSLSMLLAPWKSHWSSEHIRDLQHPEHGSKWVWGRDFQHPKAREEHEKKVCSTASKCVSCM